MRSDGATLSHSNFDLDGLLEGVTDDLDRTVRTVWVTGFMPGSRKPDAYEKSLANIRRRMADLAEAEADRDCYAEVYLKNFDYRLPKGIPWTAFPVLAPPRLKRRSIARYGDDIAHVVVPDPAAGMESSHGIPSMAALAEARDMVVDVHGDDSQDPATNRLDGLMVLAWACLMCPDIAPAVGRIGFRGEDGRFAWHTPEEAASGIRGMLGWVRFRYCYMVNANAILAKALAHAVKDADLEAVVRDCKRLGIEAGRTQSPEGGVSLGLAWSRRRDVWAGDLHELCHPLALQMLFRIARRGGVGPDPFLGGTRLRAYLPGMFDGAPTFCGPSFELTWAGGGKHMPQVYMSGRAHGMAKTLACLGLVRLDRADRLVVSPAGRRFLDAIHPDMEDPDVVCRWIRPILANEDIAPKVDAWIGKTFTKAKTRVNKLRPEAPDFGEHGLPPTPWES